MNSILITGGTGLIGKHLSDLLKEKGYNVLVLSRTKNKNQNTFYWNVDENYIDKEAIIKANYIIHLAGESIADKRWTKIRKKEIIESRVKSTNLLFRKVKRLNPKLNGFISASGIGYYGTIISTKIFTEQDNSGNDFLSEVCVSWENASNQFKTLNIRTVILRTGVVFSKKGGALEKILKPIKFGIGSSIGSGNQYTPWIHIDDLCNMYAKAIENTEVKGIYNAVTPEHITNKSLTKIIAKTLKKPLWLPNIPAFIFKLIFGEMAIILLEGSRVSSKKIVATRFKFKYPNLKETLKDLIR